MSNRFVKLRSEFTVTKSLDDDGEFEGYASVFDDLDHHGHTVKKGAFTDGIMKLRADNKRLKMLFNHDQNMPIGVFKDAYEDDRGLYVQGKLTLGVQKADETRLLMKDGAIDAMSIGGYLMKDRQNKQSNTRELLKIELREISPVVFPALDSARVLSVKSLPDDPDIGDVEQCLRDAGFSRTESKRIISVIKSTSNPQRDVEKIATNLQSIINNLRGL